MDKYLLLFQVCKISPNLDITIILTFIGRFHQPDIENSYYNWMRQLAMINPVKVWQSRDEHAFVPLQHNEKMTFKV